MLFPVLTAEWLHLVLYFSTEYNNPYAAFESATNVGGSLSVQAKTEANLFFTTYLGERKCNVYDKLLNADLYMPANL